MLPASGELTSRIARCIGIWETNRGKDEPAPAESSLDTVCGVRASMATIEQATMPYAVEAIRTYTKLRALASPALTKKELDDADVVCQAVRRLLDLVTDAVSHGTNLETFIANRSAELAAAYLTAADVQTMFRAVALRKRIVAANAAVEAGSTFDAEIAKIPQDERLGIGKGSLKSYIRKPANWGENRAAWQRKGVNAIPRDIGVRIRTVAETSKGTALIMPVVGTRLDKELKKSPVPALEKIVISVARQNNPGEAEYGENVWKTYQRLYAV